MVAALLASAALIVAASLLVGQALLALAGRRGWTPLAGPVGLALLLAASGIVAGAGGRGTAIAIVLGALATGAAVALGSRARALAPARAAPPGGSARAERRPGPLRRPSPAVVGGLAAAAALIAAVAAALPFIAAGRVGILGMGLVNDDMAYHLLMADWLAERFSPEPELIADGYPLGPHGLVAGLGSLLGARSIDVFAGLVLAVPALTALVAFAALGGLRPLARTAISALVALPYLAAAYLAQEAFKEPIMALFLLGFVLLAAERPAERALAASPQRRRSAAFPQRSGGPAERPLAPRYRWGRGVALGAIAGGMIYVYSFPGLAWLAAALGAWGLVDLARARRAGFAAAVRSLAAQAAPAALAGFAAWAAITLPDLGRVLDFTDFRALDPDRAHEGGLGNLRGHISPLAALGIWPTGEFRLPAGAGSLPAAAFYAGALLAAAGLAAGLARWASVRGPAIPAALAGAVVVYAGARGFGTVYTSAKALAIVAPLIALVALGGLASARPGRSVAAPRALLAAAIAVGMAGSSFLVLREATVGPEDHLDELAEIRPLVADEELLYLGRDNFVLYGLRGSRPHTHVRNFYNPYSVAPNEGLDRVRAKFDFDSVGAETLARFPYVLTTRAAYASGPPPEYEAVRETESYVLWARGGDPGAREPVEDDLSPGAVLECAAGQPPPGAIAASLDRRPVLAGDGDWRPGGRIENGEPAALELELGRGDWDLSLQYDATAPITLSARGLEVELPGNLAYRGASPFWPAGRVEAHRGGPLRIEVSLERPGRAGRLLGATNLAFLGTIAATPAGRGYGAARRSAEPPFPGAGASLTRAPGACGRYADWIDRGGP